MDQGLKFVVSNLGVFGVILLFFIVFWLYDKRRKKFEKNQNDVKKLKPGKLFLKEGVPLKWDENLKAKIEQWIDLKNGRHVKGAQGELICYLNERGKSAFKGFLNIHPEDLPTRIVFFSVNGNLDLRLDEDWGFQMFVGPAKAAFKEKYEGRLSSLVKELSIVLKPKNPQPKAGDFDFIQVALLGFLYVDCR